MTPQPFASTPLYLRRVYRIIDRKAEYNLVRFADMFASGMPVAVLQEIETARNVVVPRTEFEFNWEEVAKPLRKRV